MSQCLVLLTLLLMTIQMSQTQVICSAYNFFTSVVFGCGTCPSLLCGVLYLLGLAICAILPQEHHPLITEVTAQ